MMQANEPKVPMGLRISALVLLLFPLTILVSGLTQLAAASRWDYPAVSVLVALATLIAAVAGAAGWLLLPSTMIGRLSNAVSRAPFGSRRWKHILAAGFIAVWLIALPGAWVFLFRNGPPNGLSAGDMDPFDPLWHKWFASLLAAIAPVFGLVTGLLRAVRRALKG